MAAQVWLYFGCRDAQSGHCLYVRGMQRAPRAFHGMNRFDGALAPHPPLNQDRAALSRLGGHGYSALS